jgi:hypothetical protein
LLVFLDIVQRVQKWLRLRQSGDSNDQHLKQDIKSNVEDLKDQQKSKTRRWNQAGHEDFEESNLTESSRGLDRVRASDLLASNHTTEKQTLAQRTGASDHASLKYVSFLNKM